MGSMGQRRNLPVIPVSAFVDEKGDPLFPPLKKEVLQGAKPSGVVVQIDFSSKDSGVSNKPYIVKDIGHEDKLIDGVSVRTYISQFVAPTSDGGLKAYEAYGVSPQEISGAVALFRDWNESTQSPIGQFSVSINKEIKETEKELEETQVEIDSLSRKIGDITDPDQRMDAEAYLEVLREKQRKLAEIMEGAIAAERKLK